MAEFLSHNIAIVLVAVLIGAIVGYLLLRPRQKVRLSDSTPTRPHMAGYPKRRDTVPPFSLPDPPA